MIYSHKLNSQIFIPYKSCAFSNEYLIFLGPLKRQSEIKNITEARKLILVAMYVRR